MLPPGHRGDIADIEDLAALLDRLDERLRLLALHLRAPHLLDEVAAGRSDISAIQALIWRQRAALQRALRDAMEDP